MRTLLSWRGALAVLVLAALCTWSLFIPYHKLGILIDDYHFVQMARDLLQNGRMRHELDAAGHYRSGYLPGFGFFLVPFVALLAPHWSLLHLVSMLVMACGAVSVAMLARHFTSDSLAVGLAAAFMFNPASFEWAPTVLSDVLYSVLVLAVLWGASAAPRDRPRPWLLLGFACGYAVLVRSTGVALALALLIELASARAWRAFVPTLVALALSAVLELPFLLGYVQGESAYLGAAAHGVVLSWLSTFPAFVGAAFAGQGAVGWAVLAAALYGAVRFVRRYGWRAVVVYPLLHALYYMHWPLHIARYHLAVWPLLLLLALWWVPVRAAWVALAVVLLCATPRELALLRETRARAALAPVRFADVAWLNAHAPPHGCVMCVTPVMQLRPDLDLHPFPYARQWCEILEGSVQTGCLWLDLPAMEESFVTVQGTEGFAGTRHTLPPDVQAWMQASTLVDHGFANDFAQVGRVQVDPTRWEPAFRLFLRGQSDPDLAARVRDLQQALALVPDFPEARRLLAAVRLQQGQPAAGVALLEAELAQYPFDVPAIQLMVAARQAQPEEVRTTLTKLRARLARLPCPDARAAVDALLRQAGARMPPGKGGALPNR